uniref:DNRLRE domain-containing protein n=1 Tax=Sporosalibacterium faouarense TaxID=516123 RepID=UPI00192B835B
MPTIILTPNENPYIAKAYPNTNFIDTIPMFIGSFTSLNDIYRTLITIDTPTIPPGGTFSNAYLRIYLSRKDYAGTFPIMVFRPKTLFDPDTVTF